MTGTLRIDGLRELDRVLAQIGDPKAATRVGRAALRKQAKRLEGLIIAAAPAGTRSTLRRRKRKDGTVAEADYGRIRTNIRARAVRTGADTKAVVFTISTGSAFWGWFQEFGTSDQPARPFMRPLWEANKMPTLNGIADDFSAGVTRLAKRRGVNATGRSI